MSTPAAANPRVNARLDEMTESQLRYLTQTTGHSVSHVLRDSVARYFVHVQSQQRQPTRLLALMGKGDSQRHELASNVKNELTEALTAKHGLRRK
jgi:hypothetical protein